VPAERWVFDEEVASCFSDMLERSIPELSTMREAVTELAIKYAVPGTEILDLGCSTGDGVRPLVTKFGAANFYVLCDSSPAMLAKAREAFKGWVSAGIMRVMHQDLRDGLPPCHPSVALSVLTLQFIPVEHRPRIVKDIYDRLRPGGALIIVEKVLIVDHGLQESIRTLYEDSKQRNGYSRESIEAKRSSLEHVLVPLTAEWNEDLLRTAGFVVEPFWRRLNFCGWIAIKK